LSEPLTKPTIMAMDAISGEGREQQEHAELDPRGDVPADTFAVRLLLTRHHAGHLSIREAADLCGIGRGAWTNWERGARPADILEVCEIIADKLNMDRQWLLFGGALLSARGRPVKRPTDLTRKYLERSVRTSAARSIGRPGSSTPAQAVRRPMLIDRAALPAVA
jgi:transcriptional regulator with XRE-family HTH domain